MVLVGVVGWGWGEEVWDDVFEFAVFVACAGERGGVVFAFGEEGDSGVGWG